MIRLDPQEHGVFWARLCGGSEGVLAVRCDPWDAMRVATKRERERMAKTRRTVQKKAGIAFGLYPIQRARSSRPDPYAYLHRTDEEVGHLAHTGEDA